MAELTPEALQERKKGIGASEAARIVSGDWYSLWAEKTGRVEAKQILTPWDRALRHAMEPLILDWYQKVFDVALIHRGAVMVSKEYPILRCTLDALDPQKLKPIDAKALNLYTPDPLKWCHDHYAAQMQHQMICTGMQKGSLYVSLGMKEPVEVEYDFDEFWAMDYIGKCEEFWAYVTSDTPPPGGGLAAMAPAPEPVKTFRDVDMSSSNEWGAAATSWLENRKPAKKFEKAAESLKKLVASDVGRAFGKGIEIKRAKNGNLSIKELEDV